MESTRSTHAVQMLASPKAECQTCRFLHAWIKGRPPAVAMATGAWVATQKLKTLGARLGEDFDASKLPL
ncbi:hypothetical protein AK812_SmicGene16877 [Symbiodinium microadriaticum]|uniref:Uncharacterized protein n=1 Tax=Symbiodinium microadriaticum TaxID=2951 RepID=A0A1Q9DZ36_SYMMI|nr:hypothetical protein AK812_SmicGene16877 [Symbiodinium microadriaticum]